MPITRINTIGSILVSNSTDVLQALKLHGITNRTLSPGLQELMQMPAGQADVDYVATMQVAPMITATCTELAVAMGIGLAGMAIGTDPNFKADAYWTTVSQNAIRASGSNHYRHRMSQGMITVNTLSWSHPGQATCEVSLHPTFDGTNAPLIYAASVALPETPAIAEAYVGGPVFINGTEVESVDAITVDLGLTVVRRYTSGLVRPVFASIQTRSPRITVTSRDVVNLSTFGLEGTAQGGTPSEVYFRKMNKHGTRVTNATAEHIKFTILANKGEIWMGDAGGGNNEDATNSIIIQPSQMPTVSTTSTIPGSS